MIDRRAFAAGTLLAIPGLARARPAARDLSLSEILKRHTAARGGAPALDAIHALRVDLETSEKGTLLKACYRATVEHLMRIDVALSGKRVWSEGVDAAGPWAWPGGQGEPAPSGGDAERALRHGIDFNLFGLHWFPALGHRLSLAGREVVDGIDHYVIQVDMADGFQTFRYLDPSSWMVVRSRDIRALHPDADASRKWIENVYEAYRPVDGVQVSFASRQLDLATGAVLQETRLQNQTHNPPMAGLNLGRNDPSLV